MLSSIEGSAFRQAGDRVLGDGVRGGVCNWARRSMGQQAWAWLRWAKMSCARTRSRRVGGDAENKDSWRQDRVHERGTESYSRERTRRPGRKNRRGRSARRRIAGAPQAVVVSHLPLLIILPPLGSCVFINCVAAAVHCARERERHVRPGKIKVKGESVEGGGGS